MISTDIMKKVAEVAPAKYRFIMKTASEVGSSPFRDEILTDLDRLIKKATYQKTAGFLGRLGGAMKAPAIGIGSVVATGIAASLAGDMYDSLKRGITKGRDYRAMMKENPNLAQLDAKEVQKAFSVLHKFNPEFAGDPTVAGNFVSQQAQLANQGFDTRQLTELVGSHKTIRESKKLPIPSQAPWEGKSEKAMRDLQMQQMQGNIAQTSQNMQQNKEKHPLEMQKSRDSISQSADESKRKGEEHGWKRQKAPAEAYGAKLKNLQTENSLANDLQSGGLSRLTLRERQRLGLL